MGFGNSPGLEATNFRQFCLRIAEKRQERGHPPLWNTTGAGMLLKRMEMQKGPLYGLVGSNDVKYNQSSTLEQNLCNVLVTHDVYEKQDS